MPTWVVSLSAKSHPKNAADTPINAVLFTDDKEGKRVYTVSELCQTNVVLSFITFIVDVLIVNSI